MIRRVLARTLVLPLVVGGCGSVTVDRVADASSDDVAAIDAPVAERDAAGDVLLEASDPGDAADADRDAPAAPSALRVVSTDPTDGASDVEPARRASIVFSRPIVAPKTKDDVSVSASTFAVPITSELSSDGTTLTISAGGWPLLATVVVTLTTKIVAVDGGRLAHDYVFRFDTKDGAWFTPTVVSETGYFLDIAITDDNRVGLVSDRGVDVERPSHAHTIETTGVTDVEAAIAADPRGTFAVAFANRTAGGLGSARSRLYRGSSTVDEIVYDPTATNPPKLAVDRGRPDAPIWAAWVTGEGISIATESATLAKIAKVTPSSSSVGVFGFAAGGPWLGVAWTNTEGLFAQRLRPDDAVHPTSLAEEPPSPALDTGGIAWPTPKVAMSGDGALFVAWNAGATAKVARFDGVWTKEALDAGVTGTGVADVTLAASIGGDAIVGWSNPSKGVGVARYDAESKSWRPVTYVAPSGRPGYAHSSAMDAAGNALIAWTDPKGVWLCRYDHLADSWSAPFLIGEGGSEARVALGARGGVCAWEHPNVTVALLE